jgi:hypothetical protein
LRIFVIRKLDAACYVCRAQELDRDIGKAIFFPSVNSADIYRLQLTTPDAYEICEWTSDGRALSIATNAT